MSMTDTPTLTVADKARLAADYIDARDWPEGTALDIYVAGWDALVTVATLNADALLAARRQVGPVTRRERAGGFVLEAKPYDGVRVEIEPPRDMCERVQVGTREVPVYETRCPESVLALGSEVPA